MYIYINVHIYTCTYMYQHLNNEIFHCNYGHFLPVI